jgi:hypothetical protein
MSRVPAPLDGAAATARADLPEGDVPGFDRLAAALLATPRAPLGAALRAHLPGTAGVRWLRQERLAPTSRAADLTPAQWLSLFRCWASAGRSGNGHVTGPRTAGRPSTTHGRGPGSMAIPRWGS